MDFQFLARYLFFSLLCVTLWGWQGDASAQVYKSYDADGNVVFSDKPGDSSQEVNISKPNVSDSFEAPPPEPAPPPPTPEPVTAPQPEPVEEIDNPDTNNDGRISRREIDDYRDLQRKKRRAERKARGEDQKEEWEE